MQITKFRLMKRVFVCVILLGLMNMSTVMAQSLKRLNPAVFNNGQKLLNPWAGGLNYAQLSEGDFNNDGKMDLFVFDKSVDRVVPFLNTGNGGETEYTFAPELIPHFPKLGSWAMLRDYDDDGIPDVFVQATANVPGIQGIQVFKGRYENNEIRFDLLKTSEGAFNILYVQQSNGSFTQVFVSPDDFPAIDDIDGDGDIDVLTFSQSGGQIYLYENQSIERGFGKDSLQFIRTDLCWGDLFETGIDACVTLSSSPDECATGFVGGETPANRTGVHVGSTLLTFDGDNDGDKELILGDLSFNVLVYCENGGTRDNAWIVDQDCSFPSYNTSALISSFPASFYLDVDGDGLKDLMAAPNLSITRGEDYNGLWFYRNITSNEFPEFELVQKNFLIEGMIDAGTESHPAFVDYNGDGLMDIVIGCETRFDPLKPINPFLMLYANTGTASEPNYILLDEDWLGFNDRVNSTNNSLHPTFADMDNDGDQDILVGEASGRLFYGENTAGPGNPMQFPSFEFDYDSIDVGSFSTPTVVDLNRDGLPDLVIGESRGKLNYYENTGTANSPQFSRTPTNDFLGQVDVRSQGAFEGFSSPLFLDHNGSYRLFSGSIGGDIWYYEDIENNLLPGEAFTRVDSTYGEVNEGTESNLALADINNDEILDLLVGNRRGGLSLFESTFKVDGTVGLPDFAPLSALKVYPNPAQTQLQVEFPERLEGVLRVYDTQGRLLMKMNINTAEQQLEVGSLATGVYFLEVQTTATTYRSRFIVE